MKKLIICICFFSGMSFIYSQPTFFFHNKNIKEWYITTKKEKLQEEINKIITISEFEKLLTANKVNKESLFNLFNFVDFDQNGLNDLLFQGKIGNRNYVILFKKKSNEEYTIVFNQTGEILQANSPFQDLPLAFTIWDPNCCGKKVSTITHWTCKIKNGIGYYERQEQSLLYLNTFLPTVSETIKLQHFTIKNNVAKLRLSPRWDDESLIEGINAWRGNHVSFHPLGATGTMYYSLTDKENNTWCFVKINTGQSFPTKSDRFKLSQEIDNCEDYSYYGWIHIDNLTFINP